ncbi:4-coumarate--CoA ligase 2-like [Contarinia nasturtii]|uniref:4-coumarate--CoA ligase 2-like n=1 Tax=Contarinia nasturtii TaxID=265458 RepID=UPI0012D403CC|nr:4-coumarate--CoA ligase 2-like [Contarinia nasturtii]
MFRTIHDQNKRQWSGPKTESIFNPRISLGSVILNALEVNGSRVAQICAKTNKQTTFADLHTLTIRAAKKFQHYGFKKGQLIFVLTDNSADVPPLVFAALCLGCVVTSLPLCYTKLEYSQYFSIVRPNYVICDLKFYVTLNECFMDLSIVDVEFFTFDGHLDETHPIEKIFEGNDSDLYFVPTEVSGVTDAAFIFQTSGTSGQTKGVCISHAAVIDKIQRFSQFIKSTDIIMGLINLDRITIIRYLFAATLYGATRLVNVRPFTAERFFELVERYEVTNVMESPHRVAELLNHPQIETAKLFSIKYYTCGSAYLSYDAIRKMGSYLNGGRFCRAFGMTETVSTIAANLNHSKNDCVGQLISGCVAKIINEKGERQGINEDGELCIKLSFPFLRYLGDSEKTRNYFDEEGFFATGDIARFDSTGDLFIVGRKKELFKCKNEHVTPTQIEEFLNKIDGVEYSCIVPIPNEECDNLPAAIVVKSINSTCTEDSIYEAVANAFSRHKWLDGGVYFVDSLPMTSSRKIKRHLIAKMTIFTMTKLTKHPETVEHIN